MDEMLTEEASSSFIRNAPSAILRTGQSFAKDRGGIQLWLCYLAKLLLFCSIAARTELGALDLQR
jgi:hypothetical protein